MWPDWFRWIMDAKCIYVLTCCNRAIWSNATFRDSADDIVYTALESCRRFIHLLCYSRRQTNLIDSALLAALSNKDKEQRAKALLCAKREVDASIQSRLCLEIRGNGICLCGCCLAWINMECLACLWENWPLRLSQQDAPTKIVQQKQVQQVKQKPSPHKTASYTPIQDKLT